MITHNRVPRTYAINGHPIEGRYHRFVSSDTGRVYWAQGLDRGRWDIHPVYPFRDHQPVGVHRGVSRSGTIFPGIFMSATVIASTRTRRDVPAAIERYER
jgi:hypothetical protein